MEKNISKILTSFNTSINKKAMSLEDIGKYFQSNIKSILEEATSAKNGCSSSLKLNNLYIDNLALKIKSYKDDEKVLSFLAKGKRDLGSIEMPVAKGGKDDFIEYFNDTKFSEKFEAAIDSLEYHLKG